MTEEGEIHTEKESLVNCKPLTHHNTPHMVFSSFKKKNPLNKQTKNPENFGELIYLREGVRCERESTICPPAS